MRVFVLCTGRCGSTTFVQAANHADNFSAGHETQVHHMGYSTSPRTEYPDNHIEVDNRLVWFLGRLYQRYGETPLYVHLRRDAASTAESFAHPKFFEGEGLMRAYRTGMIRTQQHVRSEPMPTDEQVARHYVDTVHAQIETFLRERDHTATVHLSEAKNDFAEVWDRISAAGDKQAALAEWNVRYNERPNPETTENPETTDTSEGWQSWLWG